MTTVVWIVAVAALIGATLAAVEFWWTNRERRRHDRP